MSKHRRTRTARLRAEATAIKRRLEHAVRPNMSGPVLGRANIACELSARTKATGHGGIGLVAKLISAVGLAGEIDSSLELLKLHKPYHESDHVLNIAYNALCGGQRLQDIEARRCDRVFLDGLGTESLPDPTTAGDFCRRFDAPSILALQEAINRARLKVWKRQPDAFFEQPAVIDADASIVPTDAQTKQGMDISYNGTWGYSALLVSLANTKEPYISGFWAPTGPATRASWTTTTERSRCAARPGSRRSACGATPTSRSPPSSTAGTPTGCGSSSATTPAPTWSPEPRAPTRRPTTSSSPAPSDRSPPTHANARATSKTRSSASATTRCYARQPRT